MHADCTLWILFLRPGFTRVANLQPGRCQDALQSLMPPRQAAGGAEAAELAAVKTLLIAMAKA